MQSPSPEVLSLLEYRMRSIAIGHLALKHSIAWDQTPSIEIYFDGKQVIEGKATAFTNGAIEAAIVHCRALLEFLGLQGDGQTKLKEMVKRKGKDDIGIESVAGLSKLSASNAIRSYPGTSAEAESALAYVAYLANKGLAHTTSSFTKHDQGAALIEIAFRGVPVLVINHFYIPLQIEPPSYEPQSRERAA